MASQSELQAEDARQKHVDGITRATNALYGIEWAEAAKQGMFPVDIESTMATLRLKATVVIDAYLAK